MPNNPILDHAQIGQTTYDLRDASAVRTVNGVSPDANGELSVTNGLSIVNGKLCITYVKEVEE